MSVYRRGLVRTLIPGWLMAAPLFLSAPVQAAVVTHDISGDLLGTQEAPQFYPDPLTTLTGVSFRLTSTVTGEVIGNGTPIGEGFGCSAGSGVIVVAQSDVFGDTPYLVPGSQGCGSIGFSFDVNFGSTPGPGGLAPYIGVGTVPVNFSVTGTIPFARTWNGLLQVDYTFDDLSEPMAAPEPSSAVLMLAAAGWFAAWKHRTA